MIFQRNRPPCPMILACLVAMLFFGLSSPVDAADTLQGRASVIDGDTIEIQGQRIRLHGIDAPESRQSCKDASGDSYRCGKRAAFFLDDLLKGRTTSCDKRAVDRYRRIIGACTVIDVDGEVFDVNGTMVRAGHALAYRRYSKDYVSYEGMARSEKRGIWAGQFEAPWDWRRRN